MHSALARTELDGYRDAPRDAAVAKSKDVWDRVEVEPRLAGTRMPKQL